MTKALQMLGGLAMIAGLLAVQLLALYLIARLVLIAVSFVPLIGKRHRHAQWHSFNVDGSGTQGADDRCKGLEFGMPRELLASAMLQAEQSEPSVHAAALLRIARVLAKADRGGAERMLERGLALLATLPEMERAAIAPQAMCLAACVAPDRAFALRATTT